jgi:ribonuclease-3
MSNNIMKNSKLVKLEKKILHEFNNIEFLKEALRHSSFVNERIESDMRDNERLEFLGDAVLNLVIGHILIKRFPKQKEGDLSRMRAGLVNESTLARIARDIDVGPFINLGKGEIQTNGRGKSSILADTLEAIIAAVYLDDGFDAAFNIINTHFSSSIDKVSTETVNLDYKSHLQELVQITDKIIPSYKVVLETGPDHDKTFRIQLNVRELQSEGVGKSKKMAEQDAAKNILKMIKNTDVSSDKTND